MTYLESQKLKVGDLVEYKCFIFNPKTYGLMDKFIPIPAIITKIKKYEDVKQDIYSIYLFNSKSQLHDLIYTNFIRKIK